MIKKDLESRTVYETSLRPLYESLYCGEAVRDVSADPQVGYGLDRGWFAGRKPVARELDLTMKEADWFVGLLR